MNDFMIDNSEDLWYNNTKLTEVVNDYGKTIWKKKEIQ
jgi:hypothetical protein